MQLLFPDNEQKSFEGLTSSNETSIDPAPFGAVIPLTVGLITKLINPLTNRLWAPRDVTGWVFRAAIGKAFQLPLAGSFTLTAGASTTAAIPYNATAMMIQNALTAIGAGITVSGVNGYYFLTFNATGSKAQVSGNPANLAPLSIIEAGTLIEGGAAINEVQTIHILQNPGAYVTLSDDNVTPGAEVETVAAGGAGVNGKYRIKLLPLPYDGRFTVSVAGAESGLVPWNVGEAAFTAILEAMEPIGAGNVSVFQEEVGVYLIGFQGDLAGADTPGAITANGAGLRVQETQSGNLDLRTPGIELLLQGLDEVSALFEVQGIPPGGLPQRMIRMDCKIQSTLFNSAFLTPQPGVVFYSKAEVDANFERKLGNPATNGRLLASTTAGTRSWVLPPVGTIPDGTGLINKVLLATESGVVWDNGDNINITERGALSGIINEIYTNVGAKLSPDGDGNNLVVNGQQLQMAITDLGTAVADHDSRINANAANIDDIASTISDYDTRISQNASDIVGLNNAISSVASYAISANSAGDDLVLVSQGSLSLGTVINNIQTSLGGITDIANGLDSLSTLVGSLQDYIDGTIESRISSLEANPILPSIGGTALKYVGIDAMGSLVYGDLPLFHPSGTIPVTGDYNMGPGSSMSVVNGVVVFVQEGA